MLKEYQITNFKAFAGPANIPIKPITLLFGPNSSGKSSIFQSILMLKQTLMEAKSSESSLLSKGNLVKLGSYPEFIHRHDIKRSFSFKVTLARPADIYEVFPIEGYLSFVRGACPNFNKLNESGTFETMGMSINFSYDQNLGVSVSKIDLFLGDDPVPIFTYKNEPPHDTCYKTDKFNEHAHRIYKESPTTFIKLAGINNQHKYWKSYYEIFGDREPGEIFGDREREEILERIKPNWEAASEALSKLTPDEEKAIRKKVDELYEEVRLRQETLVLCDFSGDFLILRNYLPALLNGIEVQYIIHEDFENENSNNVSLFTLSASYLFRNFLESIIYLGPLRPYPNPDVLIRDKEFMERINDINEQFCSFNMGYELKVIRFSSQASDIHDYFKLRLFEKSTGVHLSFTDVGVGVGQVFPVIINSIISKGKTLLIEQPELHLHPALQAELGDLFINSALGDNHNTFLLETHSEHLILRILRRIRETTDGELPEGVKPITPEQVAVLYVQPGKEGSEVIHIPVNEDGEFERPWPQGFFAERARELF